MRNRLFLKKIRSRPLLWIAVFAALLLSLIGLVFIAPSKSRAQVFDHFVYLPLILKPSSQYEVLAWNDLGMHCMDPGYEDFAILPPYNTLWAQVIERGSTPRLVTSGVTVTYSFVGNTRSDNKTNFWQYDQQLFGVDLPPNVGLKGFGMSGNMQLAASADHYAAVGIPLTEYLDDNLTTPYPYQIAEITVKDAQDHIIAGTRTVAPVSTELHCEYCHNDHGEGNEDIATGVVKQNILAAHDNEEDTNLMNERPVLCARCHSSNALEAPGVTNVPSLSRAIHQKHEEIDDGTMEGTCYKCHPGPQTKCLRDVMFSAGETCQDCHGNMSDVAASNRNPWLTEPRCDQCHDAAHAENSGKLYRFSTGHGNLYCQACHGSQHAIYPTVTANDNIQSILKQGHAGTINTCTVCHTNSPDSAEGPHQTGG